ncbi:MAG TPA: uracil phosphoribosyltransferase [Phycisphaerales bacterium]|nr:uracil phosphoribosyltransferase [Phycisphaerales bacterium]
MLARHPSHPNLVVLDHPLIEHKLSHLRDVETSSRAFRALLDQIAGLMVYEVTRTLPYEDVPVRTPLEVTRGKRIVGEITVCPVLRAGLGMMSGVLNMMPEARLGHIGLARDERTLEPVTYLSKLPRDLSAGPVILVDPMLATGGSAAAAIDLLRQAGARDLRMICLVAAPEGVRRLEKADAQVTIYTAALDRGINEQGFIMPGLGDAGDRLFGTQ